MDEIQQWLSNPTDYAQGRELYNTYAPRYAPNAVISAQVNGHINAVSRTILIKQLQLIITRLPVAPVTSAKYFAKANTELPEDLQKVSDEIPILYKQRDFIRYKMRDVPAGAELRELAIAAVDLDKDIRAKYKVLDYYARTGNYPPEYFGKAEPDRDLVAKLTFWLRAMKKYPSAISRNKVLPDKAAEVAEMQKVLNDITEYLADAPED